MPELNFDITTKAELSGAQATAESLEKLIGKAKALGNADDLQKYQAQLERVNAAIKNSAVANKDAAASAEELAQQMGVVNVSADDAAVILGENAKGAKEASLSHRELHEAIRSATMDYPLLGEAARAALNPLVLSAFAIAESFNIWTERLKTATELLGGIELPDFTVHARGVNAAADAYNKMATAVSGANEEFNSSADAFERQSKAITAQLDATKQLIEAQKNKAIADLDIEHSTGAVTPGQYEARKAIIEQGANDQTTAAEITARNNDLIARRNEVKGLNKEAQTEAAKAAGIQPGMSDTDLEDLIKKVKDAAADAGKKASEFRAEAQHASEVSERAQGGGGLPMLEDTVENIPGDVMFFKKYGLAADPEEVKRLNEAQAKAQEETQTGLDSQAAQLQKQLDARKKHSEEAARLAGEAQKKGLEVQADSDPKNIGSVAWQNAQEAGTQKTRDATAAEERFAKDVDNFNRDSDQYKSAAGKVDPESLSKASAAMNDMVSLVNDAVSAMNTLADKHQDISALRQEVKTLKSRLGELEHSHSQTSAATYSGT